MIDTYHCPKCEGVVSIDDYELPVFQCDDCIVRKPIFGCGSEEFDMVFTFCVDSAGRCFDPAQLRAFLQLTISSFQPSNRLRDSLIQNVY